MEERDRIDSWLKELYYQSKEASRQSLYNGTSDAIEQVIKGHGKINYYQHSFQGSQQIIACLLARWQGLSASVDSEVAMYESLGDYGFDEYVDATFGERTSTSSSYIHDDKSVSRQESSGFRRNIPDGIEDFATLVPWAKNYYQEGISALKGMQKHLERVAI